MARVMTEAERESFLAEPQVGVVSVASDDGRPPHTVPVWYDYTPGGDVTFFTGTQGQKARKTRLIRKAGRVSFCVQNGQQPYRYVTVEGTVTSMLQPPSMEQFLAIAGRYLPEPDARQFAELELSRPDSTLVLFVVRPDRWLSFDFGA